MEEVNGIHNDCYLSVPKVGRIQMVYMRGIPEAGKNQIRHPQSGDETNGLRKPCCLGVPKAGKEQMGYRPSTVFGF